MPRYSAEGGQSSSPQPLRPEARTEQLDLVRDLDEHSRRLRHPKNRGSRQRDMPNRACPPTIANADIKRRNPGTDNRNGSEQPVKQARA
jgi:hypothetical protein